MANCRHLSQCVHLFVLVLDVNAAHAMSYICLIQRLTRSAGQPFLWRYSLRDTNEFAWYCCNDEIAVLFVSEEVEKPAGTSKLVSPSQNRTETSRQSRYNTCLHPNNGALGGPIRRKNMNKITNLQITVFGDLLSDAVSHKRKVFVIVFAFNSGTLAVTFRKFKFIWATFGLL